MQEEILKKQYRVGCTLGPARYTEFYKEIGMIKSDMPREGRSSRAEMRLIEGPLPHFEALIILYSESGRVLDTYANRVRALIEKYGMNPA